MGDDNRKSIDADAELVLAAKKGSLPAFEELVQRHERRVYGLTRRITGSDSDAADLTQQAFLSAMQNLSRFRGSSSFGTWITAIAANAAMKIVRRRRTVPFVSLDEASSPDADGHVPHPEYIADWRENPGELLQRRETRRMLDSAIAKLDPIHRAVFLARDVEGLSVRETSKALGITEGNVKVRLLRARLQLRELLTRHFGDTSRVYEPVRHDGGLDQYAHSHGGKT